MNMIDWYKKVVFENYANFKGRATRNEFWYYSLINILLYILCIFSIVLLGEVTDYETSEAISGIIAIIFTLYYLCVLIPSLAVTVRRLHDAGKSGWNFLVYFIPFVGPILLLVFLATDSDIFTNKWGPNPKAPADEINDIGLI